MKQKRTKIDTTETNFLFEAEPNQAQLLATDARARAAAFDFAHWHIEQNLPPPCFYKPNLTWKLYTKLQR